MPQPLWSPQPFCRRSSRGLRSSLGLASRFGPRSRFRQQQFTEKPLVGERKPTEHTLHLRNHEGAARYIRLRLVRSHSTNRLIRVRPRHRNHIRHDNHVRRPPLPSSDTHPAILDAILVRRLPLPFNKSPDNLHTIRRHFHGPKPLRGPIIILTHKS